MHTSLARQHRKAINTAQRVLQLTLRRSDWHTKKKKKNLLRVRTKTHFGFFLSCLYSAICSADPAHLSPWIHRHPGPVEGQPSLQPHQRGDQASCWGDGHRLRVGGHPQHRLEQSGKSRGTKKLIGTAFSTHEPGPGVAVRFTAHLWGVLTAAGPSV